MWGQPHAPWPCFPEASLPRTPEPRSRVLTKAVKAVRAPLGPAACRGRHWADLSHLQRSRDLASTLGLLDPTLGHQGATSSHRGHRSSPPAPTLCPADPHAPTQAPTDSGGQAQALQGGQPSSAVGPGKPETELPADVYGRAQPRPALARSLSSGVPGGGACTLAPGTTSQAPGHRVCWAHGPHLRNTSGVGRTPRSSPAPSPALGSKLHSSRVSAAGPREWVKVWTPRAPPARAPCSRTGREVRAPCLLHTVGGKTGTERVRGCASMSGARFPEAVTSDLTILACVPPGSACCLSPNPPQTHRAHPGLGSLGLRCPLGGGRDGADRVLMLLLTG